MSDDETPDNVVQLPRIGSPPPPPVPLPPDLDGTGPTPDDGGGPVRISSFDAPSVPGAFVVNIGELLEVATDGYLTATDHRVVSPRAPHDRISVPFFFNPSLDAELPRIDLPAELAPHARGVAQDPANPIYGLHGENALKSRLRAHPDVAEIWHADLVAARA